MELNTSIVSDSSAGNHSQNAQEAGNQDAEMMIDQRQTGEAKESQDLKKDLGSKIPHDS
jgi:hypothetical protein